MSKRTLLFLLLGMLIIIWGIICVRNLRLTRIRLSMRCEEVDSENIKGIISLFSKREAGLVQKVDPNLGFKEVWLDQMNTLGKLHSPLGRVVIWTGEVTYINRWPMSEFVWEYYLYGVWKIFPHDSSEPVFFRFLVGSFNDRKSIGEGRAIVVGEESRIGRIKEGDKITLLATVAGTDYTVGSLILYAHDVFIWQ